eukprot:gene9087-1391_t
MAVRGICVAEMGSRNTVFVGRAYFFASLIALICLHGTLAMGMFGVMLSTSTVITAVSSMKLSILPTTITEWNWNLTQEDLINGSKLITRRPPPATLSFSFPFYGLPTRVVRVATGDDPNIEVSVAAFYIAPLMADFGSSNKSISHIYLKDFGKYLVVQWRGIILHSKQTERPFSFQCTLHRDGRIEFFYKEVPISPASIQIDPVDRYPVTIGIADSYIRRHVLNGVEYIVRYDYHSINVPKSRVENTTVIRFIPLPTCHSFKTCTTCLEHDTVFDCTWCSGLGRCSDGTDRFREEFLKAQCHAEGTNRIQSTNACPSPAQRTYVFQFVWPSANFSTDCWYWLAVRIDHKISDLSGMEEIPRDDGVLTVKFSLQLTEMQSRDVLSHLAANVPLQCDGSIQTLSQVQRQASAHVALHRRLRKLSAIYGSDCVTHLCSVSSIGALIYGYRNPHSSLGQWMITHRRCKGICWGFETNTPSSDYDADCLSFNMPSTTTDTCKNST